MSNYEKILIGRSIPLDEVDDEESNLNDLIPIAEIDADFVTIIDHLGTEEFKFIFLNLINEIKSLSFERQKELCQKLENKVLEIYDFEFSPILTFDNNEDINDFLEFIEFLEYDYIDFLANIIHGLDFNLLKKDLNNFLTLNFDKINLNINTYNNKNKIISVFIRTNNKVGLLSFIKSGLEKDKMLIMLKSLEGEL
jgi:hypothetical protein